MFKLEYIWIDGVEPTAQLRSKTKVLQEFDANISSCPVWSFDGSSTNQAPGSDSDCVLKPMKLYENPMEKNNSYLVLCEVWDVEGSPHKTNHRMMLEELLDKNKDEDVWVGFEQEYTLFTHGHPLGWEGGTPPPQGDYYCGRNKGEWIARKHMDLCIKAGIKISGINSEVMLGQWEYQIGAGNPIRMSDDLWVSRWLLEKLCDKYELKVSLDPKPVKGDWNGAGCHTNFSTKPMREEGGDKVIHDAIQNLEYKHHKHIEVYGDGNQHRLTGQHETCPINEFRWGVSDRGASIRVPWQVAKDGMGYLEDRRPSANCNPYLVSWRLVKTICE